MADPATPVTPVPVTADPPAPIVGGQVVTPDPADDDLGDAGKKALEQERKARRDAERAAKTAQSALEKAQRDAMSEQERAVAEAFDRGKSEGSTVGTQRYISAEVKAAAAAKNFNNPADAVALLDLTKFEVGDDGETDTAAISSAIDDLLTERPYLASGATPLRVTPVPTGARGGAQPVDGNDWLRSQRNRR